MSFVSLSVHLHDMHRLILIFSFFTVLLQAAASENFSADTAKIRLETADSWQFSKAIYEFGPRIIGNVIMSHDSAFLFCDSAWLNETENKVVAYGNVRIKLSDTLNLYSDTLRYDGNTKIARAKSNVRLIDNQTTLTTDTLVYNRNTQIAQYDYWGKIVNGKNFLVSHYGYYYTDLKHFFFRDKVILINPDYKMYSDTLKYNTVTEIAYFFGPSHILSNDKADSIYCENGWYDTRHDISRFREKAGIYHENIFLTGDSMYYERKKGFGQVYHHAVILDTVQDVLLTGNYGEMRRADGFAFMTDSAVAILAEKKDSLFMHGDTVRALFDTAQNINEVHCYFKVKFYRTNLQGMCDSLSWHRSDSALTMYKDPVLWSSKNQLTADSIRLQMRNGEADSLKLFNTAFIIMKDDSGQFNQVKGRNILAKFRKNELYKVNVLGNAQTIYYLRDDDKSLIGINMVKSADMLIFLENNDLLSITYQSSPEAHLYPEKDVPLNERKLRNFSWKEELRPLKKEDIFIWKKD
ncbi:MAG: organic solvent tolerance protein OstA [Alphaproteobacteria bacterium]|nr:organic solvent tolerance protein OstA [Alphaproteobacteria bacterium]